MAIRTRTKAGGREVREETCNSKGKPARSGVITVGDQIITDSTGVHKFTDGHLTWKPCEHVVYRGSANLWTGTPRYYRFATDATVATYPMYLTSYNAASVTYDPAMVEAAAYDLIRKIDLNCQDRVMSYSFIADLLPFVGVVTRTSSILNKIGRWASKAIRDLRHKPFTTVMQQAISADFINRFVIQTTLHDMQQILSVYERCLRAFQLANQRNADFTVLSGDASTTETEGSVSTFGWRANYAPASEVYYRADYQVVSTWSCQMKARLQLRYDTSSADPLKWVGHALGADTPLESIWDKVPFSFVVDYFFRVGDFINYLGDKKGQTGLVGYVCSVQGCWVMEKANHVRRYFHLRTEGYDTNRYAVAWDKPATIETAGFRSFRRYGIDLPTLGGFWDQGGLWKPQLSSVRKRTLLELGWQIAGRGRS